MLECRYYGKCAGACDGHGLCVSFRNATYECEDFEPMPDVKALKELVRMFESDAALVYPYQLDESTANETLYTRANVLSHIYRMREALGKVG